jgi:UDP-N-acetyl-2-amino-2-deoxyglucuronate dehydrogenase
MENQTPLRVGIVGCGYQGGILAQTSIKGNAWRIVACADPDRAAAARVAAIAGGAAAYASTEELLQCMDVDAVFVATSHDALYECSLAAIQAGKHVLAEKPIGLDEKEAAQLEEAVARSNVCFMAGYSFRYIAAWQKVAELLQAGAVGEIQAITGAIGIPPMSSGWRASPETGGGPMLYVGSHLVDQILWTMADDPVEVFAGIRYRADTRADETTTFQIQFSRGTVAQGMVTQTSHAGLYSNLDIYGRQGRIGLHGVDFTYAVDVVSSALPAYSQPTSIQLPQMEDLRILMHQPQLAEFAQAIRERRQPAITVSDGRRVLKVLDTFIKSERTGQPVRIS